MMYPVVYLIGTGPGDPGLISARGLRYLASADVILYDHLVHRRPYDVTLHIFGAGIDYVRRGVHFVENHDEPRAAATFDLGAHRPAA